MAWNYEKMPTLALRDLEGETECALVRAEVHEDIEKYKRLSDRLKEIRAELKNRELNKEKNRQIIENDTHINTEYDYETWKEVQNSEIEHLEREVDNLRKVANPWEHFENWDAVKDYIDADTADLSVKEEFADNLEKWLEEIYIQVKPLFEQLLEHYANCEDNKIYHLYDKYIEDFWKEKNAN